MHENAPIPKWHMALILAATLFVLVFVIPRGCENERPVYVHHLRQEVQNVQR